MWQSHNSDNTCHFRWLSKFPDILWPPPHRVTTLQTMWNSLTIPWRFAALGMLSVTHIMLVLVLNTCMDANRHFTINSFRQLFPDRIFPPTLLWFLVKSLTFPWQLSNSLTFPGFQTSGHPVLNFLTRQVSGNPENAL